MSTSKEQLKLEMKKKIPFILTFKKVKNLDINLTQLVQDLYDEN